MKTWVKYGAAIMGLLIVSALIISFGMKKEESYRDITVSYTHLDVYKRQPEGRRFKSCPRNLSKPFTRMPR